MQRTFKRMAGVLLLLIFAVYYVDISFFTHTHIINGVTIVHSHFYGKNHLKAGTHTTSELTMISALSSFQSLQASSFTAGIGLFLMLQAVITAITNNKTYYRPAFHCPLRAPPCEMNN